MTFCCTRPLFVASIGFTVGPWTKQVWTVWAPLYVDFFFKKYYSITSFVLGWINRCITVDTEDQLWDLSICGFYYPWQVLEPIPHRHPWWTTVIASSFFFFFCQWMIQPIPFLFSLTLPRQHSTPSSHHSASIETLWEEITGESGIARRSTVFLPELFCSCCFYNSC